MINEIISALLQVLAFALIPLIVYLIKKRSVKGFFDYMGIKKSNRKADALAIDCACFGSPDAGTDGHQ